MLNTNTEKQHRNQTPSQNNLFTISQVRNGTTLVLEVKGKDDKQNKTKREYLNEWVEAVNAYGGFGRWCWDVSFRTSDIKDKIAKHSVNR